MLIVGLQILVRRSLSLVLDRPRRRLVSPAAKRESVLASG